MILFINTTDFNNFGIALIGEEQTFSLNKELKYNESHKTIGIIKSFLARKKVAWQNITKIIVCSGPGSFTGIRVGISIAQACGLALNIPVTTIKKSAIPDDLSLLRQYKGAKSLLANYGKEANITISKKKKY